MSPAARYLASKISVDDRALNKDVLDRLRVELASSPTPRRRVLELGSGMGTMLARLVDTKVIERAEWWLLDVDGEMLVASRRWLAGWAERRGYRCEVSVAGELRVGSPDGAVDLTIRCVEAELGEVLLPAALPAAGEAASLPLILPRADVIIANAFLDLVDVRALLPVLLAAAAPGGIYWFSLNYDGETVLEPEHPDDAVFLASYNRSMDERRRYGRPAGHSRTGRRLFAELARAGASILAAGASDWVVYPDAAGHYPHREAEFLHAIVDTVTGALQIRSELDPKAVAGWGALRRAQIDAGRLIYLAHQIDFVGRTG